MTATLECTHGLASYGATITCANGRWVGQGACPPAGTRPPPPVGPGPTGAMCGLLPTVVNGRYTALNGQGVGTTATLGCNYGFHSSGVGVTKTCTGTGNYASWTPPNTGTCVSASVRPLVFSLLLLPLRRTAHHTMRLTARLGCCVLQALPPPPPLPAPTEVIFNTNSCIIIVCADANASPRCAPSHLAGPADLRRELRPVHRHRWWRVLPLAELSQRLRRERGLRDHRLRGWLRPGHRL